jgi:hypothetical protein
MLGMMMAIAGFPAQIETSNLRVPKAYHQMDRAEIERAVIGHAYALPIGSISFGSDMKIERHAREAWSTTYRPYQYDGNDLIEETGVGPAWVYRFYTNKAGRLWMIQSQSGWSYACALHPVSQ